MTSPEADTPPDSHWVVASAALVSDTTRRRGSRCQLLRALLLLTLLTALAPLARGHASLVRTAPATGSILEQAPTAVVLVFSEPVSVTRVGLLDPKGQPLSVTAQAAGDTVRVVIPPSAVRGTYLLSWRIVSADGHPVGGTLDYAIGSPGAREAAVPAEHWRSAAIWLTRWLTWLGLFAAVGAGLFRTMAPGQHVDRARTIVVVTALLLLADLGLQGLDLLDAPVIGIFTVRSWQQALASSYALTLAGMALVLVAAWLAMRMRGGLLQRVAAGAALLLVAVAASLSGHAGTAPPQWLARPLVTLHVALALAWFGCLIPLIRHLRADLAGAASASTALARFSGWIAPAVGVLVLSGVGLAFLQLSEPRDLWHTAYGRVLLAKLALVAGLLCLAAINRWHNTQPALAGEATARRRLVRVTKGEVLLAILLLAVVSLWRLTPPPRSLAAQESVRVHVQPRTFELSGQHLRARVVQEEEGLWRIDLHDANRRPLAAQQVQLAVSSPEHGVEPLWVQAREQAPGQWLARLPALPVSAPQLQLRVLIDDFTQETLRDAPDPAMTEGAAHTHRHIDGGLLDPGHRSKP